MSEAATQTGAVVFPRHGSDYVPLPEGSKDGHLQMHAVQTINATPEQVFQVYSRVELIPAWQEGVASVTQAEGNRQHWVMEDPITGKQVEFDAEVLEAIQGERHVLRVLNGPFESTTDTVTFEAAPADRGTLVSWVSNVKLPGGTIANAFAGLAARNPEQITIENLRHLKQLIESKEIPSVEGQPAGPRGIIGRWKQFLMKEHLPTPPGSSDRAQPRDLASGQAVPLNGAVLGGVAVLIGLATWYGLRKAR